MSAGALRGVLTLLLVVESSAARVSPNEEALLQTWGKALDGGKTGVQLTPVTRVVNLLKEMGATLQKEMDEDEELYDKLACWCNNNQYEKNEAIEAAEAQIAQLEANIERLAAKSAELKETIKQTADELAADKEALATALALRQKQQQEFHGTELDAIQNVENLKAAIVVLSRHHGAFPQLSLLGLHSHHKGVSPFGTDHDSMMLGRQLDGFMLKNGFGTDKQGVQATDRAVQKFLQEQEPPKETVTNHKQLAATQMWTSMDKSVVEKAIRSASMFLQAHGHESYTPPHAAQSGEILGILKQLKEEMEGDLSEAQKTEMARVAAFDELRQAKTAEIAAGETQLQTKKEQLAQTDMDHANAKEDLEEVKGSLSEDQKFMMNLKKTCAEADGNFEIRKKTRLEEIQAVSETIGILTADEARDSMNVAYGNSFLQMSRRVHRVSGSRSRAAKMLRDAAAKSKDPALSVLATSVELDAFTKVKQMIDEMIAKLKTQQDDELKKKDWCNSEFQENDMQTRKAEDLKSDQLVQIDDLVMQIKTLGEEIEAAKAQIAETQLNLQRASENRLAANIDFQKVVAEQKATQEILAKALDKLATFYDKEFFVQVGHGKKQSPPVPQIEYKPSGGASGVMSMIEKLIYDAKEMEAESITSEAEAQAQYESLVSDSNASVGQLQRAVVTKTETKAQTERAKVETDEALAGTLKDLEGLSAYLASLHQDCDYVVKNFDIRQEGRGQEIEALQQAKQILSGALLG